MYKRQQYTLSLVGTQPTAGKAEGLTEGRWCVPPPRGIYPDEWVPFGSETHGISVATAGQTSYDAYLADAGQAGLPEERLRICLQWSVQLAGEPKVEGSAESPLLRVEAAVTSKAGATPCCVEYTITEVEYSSSIATDAVWEFKVDLDASDAESDWRACLLYTSPSPRD